jgi:hypothetical protein
MVKSRENIVNGVLPLSCTQFLLSLCNRTLLVLVAKTPQRILRYHTMLRRWLNSGQPDRKSLLQPWHPGVWGIPYQATLDFLCACFEVDAALTANQQGQARRDNPKA